MRDQPKTTIEAIEDLKAALGEFAGALLEHRLMLWVFVAGLIVIEILARLGVL